MGPTPFTNWSGLDRLKGFLDVLDGTDFVLGCALRGYDLYFVAYFFTN
jgi:hypothetical protein